MRAKNLTAGLAILATAGLVLGASSCEPEKSGNGGGQQQEQKKVSQDEIYAQVQNGMTKEQVVGIAGRNPDNCIDSEIAGIGTSSTCSYGSVSIIFQNGKVSSKTKL